MNTRDFIPQSMRDCYTLAEAFKRAHGNEEMAWLQVAERIGARGGSQMLQRICRSKARMVEDREPYCPYCNDSCAHPDDPTGQADCGFCGGSYAWRQREQFEADVNRGVSPTIARRRAHATLAR